MTANVGHRTILVALHEDWACGATQSVLRVVPRLEERGWRFVFWAPPGPIHAQLAAAGHPVAGVDRPISYTVRALRLPPGPIRRAAALPGYSRAFSRYLNDVGPDLVHANSLLAVAEAAMARIRHLPVVLHAHEVLHPGPRAALTRRFAANYLQGVMAVSQASAAPLAVDGAIPRVIHNGIGIPARSADPHSGDGPYIVGTVGVISPRKGSDVFVAAAELVRDRRADVEFRVLGAPRDALYLEWGRDLVKRANESGAVNVVGEVAVEDVEREMRGWDIMVLPSRQDPFPLALLEAMALGVPVIGSNDGGIPEMITPDCGVLVPPGEPAALSRAILDLLDRPATERAAMGLAGRERVGHVFTFDSQAEGMHATYEAALKHWQHGA